VDRRGRLARVIHAAAPGVGDLRAVVEELLQA